MGKGSDMRSGVLADWDTGRFPGGHFLCHLLLALLDLAQKNEILEN